MIEQLYSQTKIKRKVYQLAEDVAKQAKAALHVHVIMDGGFVFASDFVRGYGGKIAKITFLPISRGYSSGRVHAPRLVNPMSNYFTKSKINPDHTHLVLDVCVEKGVTLRFFRTVYNLKISTASQILTCILVANTKEGLPECDHIGFIQTEPFFLTGYGMGPYRDFGAIYGIPR